jgi:hypothetical protein
MLSLSASVAAASALLLCSCAAAGAAPESPGKPAILSPGAIDGERDESLASRRQANPYMVPPADFPGYGQVSGCDDFPSVLERMQMCWYNMVRMDPQYFKGLMPFGSAVDGNTTLKPAGPYQATSGIHWDLNLNRAARAHGADLQANCNSQLTHNDCNGTGFGTRVRRFASYGSGEILWSYKGWNGQSLHQALLAPFAMISGWICDGPMFVTCVVCFFFFLFGLLLFGPSPFSDSAAC